MSTKKLAIGLTIAGMLALLLTLVTPLRAAAVQALAIVTCASTSACTGGNNTSTGPGVQGTSAKGKGVVGQTKFNSTTTTNAQNGILGQDLSTAGTFNTGVTGTSTRGTGVLGQSSFGNGVAAQSTNGNAVQAKSSSGTALLGLSPNGTALDAESKNIGVFAVGAEGVEASDVGGASNDALLANGHGGNLMRANNRVGADVFLLQDNGTATFTNTLFANLLEGGSDTTRIGVAGSGFGVGSEGRLAPSCSLPCAGLQGTDNGTPSSVAVRANGHGGFLFLGNSSSSHDVFYVDDAGNVHAHSFNADLAASHATSTGARLTTYSSESRTPNIEDLGEAALVAGQAYVRLDSTFASGIDHSRPYLVFITPLGAVGGALYVTQRNSSGFAVREAGSARSNVSFDYRIVARPYAKPVTSSNVAPGTKPMQLMRRSVKIPRTYPQSKKFLFQSR